MQDQTTTKFTAPDPPRPSKFSLALYHLSARILYYLCGKNWFQNLRRKQRKHTALIDLFLNETNFPAASWLDIKKNCLFTDLMSELWGKRLISLAPILVEGQEHIESVQAIDKGIILAHLHQKLSNSLPSSPLMHWLSRQKFRPTHIITTRGIKKKKASEKFSNAQSLLQAYNILRKSGVIQIAPDGYHGPQAINMEFYQRQRDFRTGFAELALATQAQIIPICLQFRTDGAIVIKISPALRVSSSGTREQQIAELVNQYVEGLNKFWAAYPHMVAYRHMRLHLELPKAGIV